MARIWGADARSSRPTPVASGCSVTARRSFWSPLASPLAPPGLVDRLLRAPVLAHLIVLAGQRHAATQPVARHLERAAGHAHVADHVLHQDAQAPPDLLGRVDPVDVALDAGDLVVAARGQAGIDDADQERRQGLDVVPAAILQDRLDRLADWPPDSATRADRLAPAVGAPRAHW